MTQITQIFTDNFISLNDSNGLKQNQLSVTNGLNRLSKKSMFFKPLAALLLLAVTCSCSDRNMTANPDGSCTINTVKLGEKIKGYAGPVPVSITIKDTVIQSVAMLGNIETPEYLTDIENRMLPKYKGLSINSIREVDAVSGATFSSRAIMRNVEVAVGYYREHKLKY